MCQYCDSPAVETTEAQRKFCEDSKFELECYNFMHYGVSITYYHTPERDFANLEQRIQNARYYAKAHGLDVLKLAPMQTAEKYRALIASARQLKWVMHMEGRNMIFRAKAFRGDYALDTPFINPKMLEKVGWTARDVLGKLRRTYKGAYRADFW